MADDKSTGYWKVVHGYVTPDSKGLPVNKIGAVVSTADLGAPKGTKPSDFVSELLMLGVIAPANAPAKATGQSTSQEDSAK